jgi:hypothetical protein
MLSSTSWLHETPRTSFAPPPLPSAVRELVDLIEVSQPALPAFEGRKGSPQGGPSIFYQRQETRARGPFGEANSASRRSYCWGDSVVTCPLEWPLLGHPIVWQEDPAPSPMAANQFMSFEGTDRPNISASSPAGATARKLDL